MTIKKALEHFKWKFQNKWKATQYDIEAFDTIIDFVKKKHEKEFNDNQLFAKLYITFYGELLKYYDCTVFDNRPTKDISKILDTPIELLIEKFVTKANDQELFSRMKEKGIKLDYPITRQRMQEDAEKMEVEMLDPVMTFDEAEENLTKLINLALNEFS